MDSKLILVKAVTLLYCESICRRISKRSDELAAEVINRLKVPERVSESSMGRHAIIGLRETLIWMSEHSDEEVFDFNALIQRVRLNADDDYSIINAFEDAEQYQNYSDEKLLEVCQYLRRELKDSINQWAIRDIIQKAHRELFYSRKNVDWKTYVQDLVADLERYSNGWTQDQHDFVMNLMQMSDKNSIKKVLEQARQEAQGQGGFCSGWQRMNKLFGRTGMLHRGEFVVVGALTHNYKSSLVQDLFRHFCVYNTPQETESGGKPTILYFSAEDEAREIIVRTYSALVENESGVRPDVSQLDTDEASEFITNRLTQNGWTIDMQRIDPGEFTYKDLFNYVLAYESTGHEIHAIAFDYLGLINRKGCHSNIGGEDIRTLFQIVRNFMSSRNILFITPHQLSQQAMDLKRSGAFNFLEEVAGKNYWDGSKRIANEVDLEIYLDLINYDGVTYLGVGRGKHRTSRAAQKKNTFFYLPLYSDFVAIPDDLNKEDRSLETLTSASVGVDLNWS